MDTQKIINSFFVKKRLTKKYEVSFCYKIQTEPWY
jgi:hypothetical protein